MSNLCARQILEFDSNVDDNSKIKEIRLLKQSVCGTLLNYFLNLITCFFINVVYSWFPKLEMIICYMQDCTIQEADHVAVYDVEDGLTIVELTMLEFTEFEGKFTSKEVYFKSNVSGKQAVYLFKFMVFNYIYLEHENVFTSLKHELCVTTTQIKDELNSGLSQSERNYLIKILGTCLIEIKIKGIFNLLFGEISDPFYSFQLFSVILWFYEDYVIYAAIIFATSILCIGQGVYYTYINLVGVKKLAEYSTTVKRKNKENGEFSVVSSINLAPGDIIEVPGEDVAMPCDGILINGVSVMNECVLTGESTPVVKSDIKDSLPNYNFNIEYDSSLTKHFLYTGTKVIQKRGTKEDPKCLVLVARTGYSSEKGCMIRSIMIPDSDLGLKSQSYKYIILMFVLTIIVYASIYKFISPDENYFLKFLDMITVGVPAALPACLNFGISFAIWRLKKLSITCIKREKVNKAGQVTSCVFDKTGTLTTDTLEKFGSVYSISKVKNEKDPEIYFDQFTPALDQSSSLFENELYINKITEFNLNFESKNVNFELAYLREECYSACHSLTLINSIPRGDPIEEQMFKSAKWILASGEDSHNFKSVVYPSVFPEFRIGVCKVFDFVSRLQRMSVVTKLMSSESNNYKIFTKGSPEKLKPLCKPDSIPSNYDDILQSYTSRGLRVLSVACKLSVIPTLEKYRREDAEKNLIFLGFYIVENKLKPETAPQIQILKDAELQIAMATGDNILTGSFIAVDSGMVDANIIALELKPDGRIIVNNLENIIDIEESNSPNVKTDSALKTVKTFGRRRTRLSILETNDFTCEDQYKSKVLDTEVFNCTADSDTDNIEVEVEVKKSVILSQEELEEKVAAYLETVQFDASKKILFAIDGQMFDCFVKMKDNPNTKEEHKVKIQAMFDTYCKIYARMTPEMKAQLVIQQQSNKHVVLMCGDGANDCAALKVADVGVSLSLEEASIAAPFTSNKNNISTISGLLREGKACLVTSFLVFRYMMLYAIIVLVSSGMALATKSYITQYEFLIVDLILVLPMATFMGFTEPYPNLNRAIPPNSLFSLSIVLSLIIQTAITVMGMTSALLVLQGFSWYTPYVPPDDSSVSFTDVPGTLENTVSILINFNRQYL